MLLCFISRSSQYLTVFDHEHSVSVGRESFSSQKLELRLAESWTRSFFYYTYHQAVTVRNQSSIS